MQMRMLVSVKENYYAAGLGPGYFDGGLVHPSGYSLFWANSAGSHPAPRCLPITCQIEHRIVQRTTLQTWWRRCQSESTRCWWCRESYTILDCVPMAFTTMARLALSA